MRYLVTENQFGKLISSGFLGGDSRIIVRLFNYLNEEKKNHKSRDKLLEKIVSIIPYFGLPERYARFYLELYLLNYREDGDYSNLTEDNFVDPRYMKELRTTNQDSGLYTHAKLPFKGSNLNGYWDKDPKGVPFYVVKSYGWYPIYLFKEDKWFENTNRYSSSTGKQMNRARPEDEEVIYVTKDDMEMLMSGKNYDFVRKSRLEKLKNIDVIKKDKMFRIRIYDWQNPSVVKFKINSIDVEKDHFTVVIDVYDVVRVTNSGREIPTPEHYVEDQEPASVQGVEYRIKRFLVEKLVDYVGSFDWSDDMIDTRNMKVIFNHLKPPKNESLP